MPRGCGTSARGCAVGVGCGTDLLRVPLGVVMALGVLKRRGQQGSKMAGRGTGRGRGRTPVIRDRTLTGLMGPTMWQAPRMLTPRDVVPNVPPPDILIPYIKEAGFGGPLEMRLFDYDMPLLSAVVERWRPETHSFHLPWDGTGFSWWKTTGGRREEELCRGEDVLVEGASPRDLEAQRFPRCSEAIRALLYYNDDRRSFVSGQDQQHCFFAMGTTAV
ncbi:hypothetical protein PIB30_072647 [Stylosanthes scabra]|uniref:Aminotransferase-like plant mobile domain-containing protein n=1 Tax=Stylosanthes scabra TaxID=79078 RepID=A0ABU6XNV5_9FABA|nr:hypothetical protein [Stylosanthes scabra]